MSSQASKSTSTIRYQPDEKPPYPIALGLALQYSILALGGIVLTVAIVIRSAGSSEAYLAWGAFAALLVSGIATIIQASRLGRLGSGYLLAMGTSGAFIAVSVAALQQGGPGLLATLVIVSSLFQRFLEDFAGRKALGSGPAGRLVHAAVIGAHAAEAPEEHEFSLRLLRHLATSVQHHKYEDTDIVTVRVDPSRSSA